MNVGRKIELLAPAGSPEHLIAALDGGADAVYLGGKLFSARKYAGNFSNEEIKKAVDYAHIKGSAVYITLNTLIADREMKDLKSYLQFLSTLSVDGILVQDLGVACMVKQFAPEIPLHASTQMTVSNLSGIRFLKRLGFQRVVLARELSLEEIKKISAATDMEIEVFVHGALCVCYSGQCLMSSFIGDRSGNRGSCAQPCRMPYTLVDHAGRLMNREKGKYILSMKDVMGLEQIPELIRANVASLKIEGRMKSPDYVYDTVSAYRHAINSAYEEKIIDLNKIRLTLEEKFNRGYTSSYLDDSVGASSITEYSPGNHGVKIGEVLRLTKDGFIFRSNHGTNRSIITGVSFETANKEIGYAEAEFQSKNKADNHKVVTPIKAKVGGSVYWHIREEKHLFSIKDGKNKIPLISNFVAIPGNQMSLSFEDNDGNQVTVLSDIVAERAVKRITSSDEIRSQISRLGNTWFTLSSVTINNKDCMVPKSIINQMRQKAIMQLENIRKEKKEQHIPRPQAVKLGKRNISVVEEKPSLVVRTDKIEHIKPALDAGIRRFVFGGESFSHIPVSFEKYREVLSYVHEAGGQVTFALPTVVREYNEDKIKTQLSTLRELKPDGIEVGYPGIMEWIQENNISIPIECGPSFNLFNTQSIKLIEDLGVTAAYLSQEVTIPQIRDIVKNTGIPLGVFVYGRTQMMISEYCAINAVKTDVPKKRCPAPCLKHDYLLQDKEGRRFPVKTDEWCHMHILNCHILDMRPYLPELTKTGIKRLCLDFRGIDGNIVGICKSYSDIFEGKALHPELPGNGNNKFTRGHFFRGVL